MKSTPFMKGCATLFSTTLLLAILSGCGKQPTSESGTDSLEKPTITTTSIPPATQAPTPTSLDGDDYDAQLVDAIEILEASLPETENLALPEHLSVLDVCEGDIGNDGTMDIVVILEFEEDYPISSDDYMFAVDHRVTCIFQDNGNETFSCQAKNNALIMNKNTGGVYGDPYAGMTIQNGILTLSHYGGSSDRWGYDYRFDMYNGHLTLWQGVFFEHNTHSDGYGSTDVYDYRSGTRTWFETEHYDIYTPTNIYVFNFFEPHTIHFEDADFYSYNNYETCAPTFAESVTDMTTNVIDLAEDETVSGYEWTDDMQTCFRVQIAYKNDADNEVLPKKEYFYYFTDGIITEVLCTDCANLP